MKLLKLEIGEVPKEKQFRSLYSGFKVEFHRLDDKGIGTMAAFNPFCFAGLNGSGKSNVLEALSSIFFHLESYTSRFKPKTFEKHFRAHECKPDAFSLEYLIGLHNSKGYTLPNFFKITIRKKHGEPPRLFRKPYPFSDNEKEIEESLQPPKSKTTKTQLQRKSIYQIS